MPTWGPRGSVLCRTLTHTHTHKCAWAHTLGLQTPYAHKQEVPGPSTQEASTLNTRPRRTETGVVPGVRGQDAHRDQVSPWGDGTLQKHIVVMMLSYQTSLYILGFVYFIMIKKKKNPRSRVQNTVGVSVPAFQVPGDRDSFLQADTSHPRLKART